MNLQPASACGSRCRQVQTCAVANVDYDDYRMCVTQARALSANDGASAPEAAAVSAAALAASVILAMAMN